MKTLKLKNLILVAVLTIFTFILTGCANVD